MATIELTSVAHAYEPPTYAVHPLDLTWEDGGAYALLGPSGCGKTTLLNIISGLIQPTEGTVTFDGDDATTRPAQARNIAQVFQFPVIYDTMTVADNLAFPLRNRGVPHAKVTSRVAEVADLLELTSDLSRRARGLTADAKQRISLGRGLVREDVAAILLDEPLTVIDPHVKWLLRRKLKQVHDQLRPTLIYVTHDQEEALTIAERVIVMNDGRVVQQGTPAELFDAPAHAFVGRFIGSPGMNLLECTLDHNGADLGGVRVPFDAALLARAKGLGQSFHVGIRPESIRVSTSGLPAAVQAVQDVGSHSIVTATIAGQTVKARLEEGMPIPSEPHFELPPDKTLLYADEVLVR